MSEITKGPGPVTHYPDLLLLSFPEGPGNLRVPWLQGKPMKCSSSKPTSCCSTFQLHPAPEAPRGVASSFACQPGDKPPLLRLPREKNLIVVEREGNILNCWEVTSAGGHWGGDRRRWSHTIRSKLLQMTLLASCCVWVSSQHLQQPRALGWPKATSHPMDPCSAHPFPSSQS